MAGGSATILSGSPTPLPTFETFGPIVFEPRQEGEEVIDDDDWTPFIEAD
jgi:hypothetical protein